MRFIKKLIFIIIILTVIAVLGRNLIVKYAVPVGARFAGIKMSIGNVNIGLTDALVGIKNIEIMNPKGFPKGQMINIKEIYIDPETVDFLKDKIHLVEVRFDLDKLTIIRNKNGDFNFKKLTKAKKKQEGEPVEEKTKTEPAKKGKKKEFQIDSMKLKLGTVVYKDYSVGAEPKIVTFNLNLDEEYEDITNPAMIGSIVFSKIMMKTSLGKLTGIDMDSINAVLDIDQGDLKHLQENILGKKNTEKFNKAATDSIKKATDTIKNIF